MAPDQSGSTSGKFVLKMKAFLTHLRERGFFKYVGRNLLGILAIYGLLILIVFLIGKYLVDFEQLFQGIISRLSDRFVLLLFFASESFTGMIPVDLFVVWTQKFENSMAYLALLGVLSYLGGIISYGIGIWISRRPKFKAFSERRLRKYMGFVRKWGGAFIVIAALFPFTPFSLVVIAVTLFKYPFRLFLLYGIARLVRFVLQGIILFNLLNLDQWIV
jgi:membrane protein YqaA with SNARE-associated domain